MASEEPGHRTAGIPAEGPGPGSCSPVPANGAGGELAVGVTGFEPATSSSRTKRATKLRHTPRAAGDSIASTHRREEIGSAESSVTSVFAPS